MLNIINTAETETRASKDVVGLIDLYMSVCDVCS